MSHLQRLAKEISARKVKHVFGIPGSGPSLTLLDALEKYGVNFHLTHFEGTAAIMAGTIGKLSGQSGVSISIKGPGLTNMLPGIAACFLDSLPLVSISEAYPPDTPPEKAHKRLNHKKLLSGITKGACFLSNDGPSFDQLANWAESEVPGPVHVDIAAEPYKDDKPPPLAQDIDNAEAFSRNTLRILSKSERPVVIAGTLVLRKGWSNYLNALHIPVFTTAAAKGAVDETLPHAASVFTGVGGSLVPERIILPHADLVIGIGLRHNEVLLVSPFQCPFIQVDPVDEGYYFAFCPTETVWGEFQQVEDLFALLGEKNWGLDTLGQCLKKLCGHILEGEFLPAHVYDCIERHFNFKARVVLDTGIFCTIGEHALRISKPGLYVASGQSRYMGVGLPQSIGAALYDPSVPTVLFTGDGGIGMFFAEVKLAVRHKLPLLIILLSDGHLGTIRTKCLSDNLTQIPVAIDNPSWLSAMEGVGVPSIRIESIPSLEDSLKRWAPSSGPVFIEAFFDVDDYQAMTEQIR